MIALIHISKILKNLLTRKINYFFNCFSEKFKMTYSLLIYIFWMMTELNRKLPTIYYLQDITVCTILPYLDESFIISLKYLFDEGISIKLFSYYINQFLELICT
jgi:hypothetical protein